MNITTIEYGILMYITVYFMEYFTFLHGGFTYNIMFFSPKKISKPSKNLVKVYCLIFVRRYWVLLVQKERVACLLSM